MIRGCDIACRYGGEEFILLLPEASLQITQLRAEQIRIGAKHLNLQHRRQPLGAVSLSLGVASFPRHGNTTETLIQAADAALTLAKATGRDLVVVAQ
ncbi:MAG: diguanylate cyclase [Nostoc desertorum CM1-VF14]|jgi:diguanylate cyclase (GGDEF)-like protein|nr:diguanylate cyclase [Nostoc desertorum CM1-VF14]